MHDVLLHRSRRQRKRAQVEVFGLVPGGKLQCAWPSSENCAPAAKNEFQSFKVMSPHCSLKSNPLRHTSSPVANMIYHFSRAWRRVLFFPSTFLSESST